MTIQTEWRDYDVIVVGSGGAGSAAAHAASEAGAKVLVVSKDPIGCSDTKIAEGIVTVRASADDDDTEEVLAENLRIAGSDLPTEEITAAFAQDTQEAYEWYRRQGVRPDMDHKEDKPNVIPIALGGHTKRRSIGHQNGGLALGHALWNAVVQGIDYLEDAWFLDVITEENDDGPDDVVGGLIYDAARGVFVAVRAPSVVIASGGLSTMYFPKTDTMRGNTGDSYAFALRAGAELVDMEQVQFLPFCMTYPPAYEGLLAGEPVTAGYLGVLRDKDGKVILDSVMLRTRAECSAAIIRAVEAGRGTERDGCYLDLTGNSAMPKSGPYFDRFLHTSLSGVMATVRQAWGKNAAQCKEMWEVRPGAHYAMGGMRVNADCAAISDDDAEVPVRGLYAAGQAMGGVFGSNRLGSTSLSEGAIFGARAGRGAAAHAKTDRATPDKSPFESRLASYSTAFGVTGGDAPALLVKRLQEACWNGIGPARTEQGLDKFDAELADIRDRASKATIPADALWNQSFIEYLELMNMLDTAQAVSIAARDRDHNLGAHVRLDRGQPSALFGTPHSTVVQRSATGDYSVHHAVRPKTPLKRMLPHMISDAKRKISLKVLRMLPAGMRDNIIEERYRSVMGEVKQPEPDAVGEAASA